MSCTDSCGWTAALVAALAYGSYGVPVKATLDVDVHPFVLQSYKTVVLFVSSWSVMMFPDERVKYTPFGLLSGILWVSGGACGIYGIRKAGMAIAVGTWASVMVCVNFTWGILIFQEPVRSFAESSFAFFMLVSGLVGMSKYSSQKSFVVPTTEQTDGSQKNESTIGTSADIELIQNDGLLQQRQFHNRKESFSEHDENELAPMIIKITSSKISVSALEDDREKKAGAAEIFVRGVKLTQREAGILMAVFNGVLAGSSLVPVHYAKLQGFGNLSYILSFGFGSLIANTCLWFLFFGYHFYKQQHEESSPFLSRISVTLKGMPPWHFKELWRRGLLAGLLLSIGMFGSIIATSALGQGVGNSLVQSKILISGLWGIYYYKEIKDPDAIMKWFISAAVCVAGILLLSFERLAAKSINTQK